VRYLHHDFWHITGCSGRNAFWQYDLKHFGILFRMAKPISVGLNCALGPKELRQYYRQRLISYCWHPMLSSSPQWAGLPNGFGEYVTRSPDECLKKSPGWVGSPVSKHYWRFVVVTAPKSISKRFAAGLQTAIPLVIPLLEKTCRLSVLEPLTIEWLVMLFVKRWWTNRMWRVLACLNVF